MALMGAQLRPSVGITLERMARGGGGGGMLIGMNFVVVSRNIGCHAACQYPVDLVTSSLFPPEWSELNQEMTRLLQFRMQLPQTFCSVLGFSPLDTSAQCSELLTSLDQVWEL